MLLESALPLLKEKRMVLDIIGDGPMMQMLKDFIAINNISDQVTMHGWIDHTVVQDIMSKSNVLAFPSIREFGGGVILEAMALGIVPIVIDYAGPGDLIDDTVGIKVKMSKREAIIAEYEDVFTHILEGEYNLGKLANQSIERVKKYYTWEAKANQVYSVYQWVLDQKGEKPNPFETILPNMP
jgi:glycosyltransferase involved in cell wall biosynthesis